MSSELKKIQNAVCSRQELVKRCLTKRKSLKICFQTSFLSGKFGLEKRFDGRTAQTKNNEIQKIIEMICGDRMAKLRL